MARDIPRLDASSRNGEDTATKGSKAIVGRMLQLAVRDAKRGCAQSAKWLVSAEAQHWMQLVGLDPSHFYVKLKEVIGDKTMATGRIDKRTAVEIRRDQANAVRELAQQRQAAGEAAHQERASVAIEHVISKGLMPRRQPSFGESMASRMALLGDAMSGDLQAQAEYRRQGDTGQKSKDAEPSGTKTKDVKGTDDLATAFKAKLGDKLYKKQFSGPTTFSELAAEERARLLAGRVEQLNHQFSMLVDNIMVDGSVEDKSAAVQTLAREYDTLLTEAVATKGLGGRRRAKALMRKVLVTKGLAW